MKLLLGYIMFCIIGGFVGNKLRKEEKTLSWSGKAQTALLIILLVTMGCRLGANKEVVSSLGSIGISAFVLTICCMAGSVVAIFITRKLLKFNKKGVREND